MRAGRLGNEQGAQREVDGAAVEVEGVARGQDEADERPAAAEMFELGGHTGQDRLGGGGAEHDEELVADVAEELPQADAVQPQERAETDNDEKAAGKNNAGEKLRDGFQ